jgi:ABC-type Fe3+-hydroxamate transport system substrate-binding protein
VRHLIALVGFIALTVAACGSASPSTTASPSSSAAPTITHVTFDGQECKYDGPASVTSGTRLMFVFENTAAAIDDAKTKGAVTIGADLAVVEAIAGTTLDTVNTSLPAPAGTKGTQPSPPAWTVDWAAYAFGPKNNVMTNATGAAYYVGCHEYWDKAGGTNFAAYPATVIQVLKG